MKTKTTEETVNSIQTVWHTESFWTSEYTDKITEAMVLFNSENITIEKRGEANINAQVKRKYVKLDDIMNTVRPVLAKYNSYVEQHLAGDSVITRVVHKTGQFIASKIHYQTWEANQVNNLQRLGGGLTYLKRYAISAILNIVADDDTDAEGNDNIGYKKPQAKDNGKEWLNIYDKQGRLTVKGESAIKYIKEGGALESITSKYNVNKKDMETLRNAVTTGERLEDIYHNGEEVNDGY